MHEISLTVESWKIKANTFVRTLGTTVLLKDCMVISNCRMSCKKTKVKINLYKIFDFAKNLMVEWSRLINI